MNLSGDHNSHPAMIENSLVENTIEILDDEKQSILSEVLKCYVCLELPFEKQVRICEKGHHFCLTCHNKMKVCGICRSGLLKSRNFVVEKLVATLGPILGAPGFKLPPADPPPKPSPGTYKCPHRCSAKMPAFRMLSHLRARHSTSLLDNVRSNPYSRRFSFSYNVFFVPDEKYRWSVHVSDMGLFTVEVLFSDVDLFGCVRMLADKTVSASYRHQLVVKIPNVTCTFFLEFSVTNCPVSSYLDDSSLIRSMGKGLKIKGADLLEHIRPGSAMTLFFSVWKESEIKKSATPSVACIPERHLFFKSDRKIRRNRTRTERRKRLKEKLRNSIGSDAKSKALLENLCRLSL